ncbi:MAG: hypothetical protein IKP50_06730, partial [Bacilli bacterium]|nr:hypothetical protein [Bacilli bacterium]
HIYKTKLDSSVEIIVKRIMKRNLYSLEANKKRGTIIPIVKTIEIIMHISIGLFFFLRVLVEVKLMISFIILYKV